MPFTAMMPRLTRGQLWKISLATLVGMPLAMTGMVKRGSVLDKVPMVFSMIYGYLIRRLEVGKRKHHVRVTPACTLLLLPLMITSMLGLGIQLRET